MAPRGRRKLFLHNALPFIILLAFSTTVSAASAVLGIDLGTEYIKAAIAKTGSPIDIVLTKDSKRKEAATIAFKPSRLQINDDTAFPERLYGGDALALMARYPTDVFPNLKTVLGLPRYSEQVKTYSARYPGLKLESVSRFEDGNTRGTVGFRSQNAGDKNDVFMVEELLAMQLKNIKANAQAAVSKGTYVDDVVITYPSFYTAEEKRAIELAADLAGFRLLGLISDGLAVGFNYASSRGLETISTGGKPEHHVVYDMGAGSTTATVLKISGKTVKLYGGRNQTVPEITVLGTGFDRTLGGDALNDVIVQDMINQFVEIPNIKRFNLPPKNVREHGKTMNRLYKDAERVRQVLSANSAATASFEGLFYEDVNFKYSLTRDHFEKLTKGHTARVEKPLLQALDSAGMSLSDVTSVILHGGVVRTPFVQRHLENIAGGSSKIKTNVNADEAAAMGAAFKAASISPSFRVKEIRGVDVSGSAIAVKWTVDGKDRQQKLFTPSSHVGIEKQVPIKVLADTKFEFAIVVDEAATPILQIDATNLTKSTTELTSNHGCDASNITAQFIMRLSPLDGLPEIVSGSVSCTVNTSKEGSVLDNVKGLFGFGSKKSDKQEPLLEDNVEDIDPLLEATPLPIDDPTSSASIVSETTSAGTTASSSSTSSSRVVKASKPTETVATIPLSFRTYAVGLNAPPKKMLGKIRERLDAFDDSDRNTGLRAEALNTLESFSYRVRDYLEEEGFISASPDTIRSQLQEKLSAASDWLYGDGADAKLEELKDKLSDLKSIVDPIVKRKDENKGRPEALDKLQNSLESISGLIRMVESSVKKAAEEAAASLSSVASAVTEAVGSDTPSGEDAEGGAADDLEDDPYASTKSGASGPQETAAKPAPSAFKPYEYSQEDLSSLQTTYDTVKAWLDEKLPLQEKLTAYDDPVLLVSELQAKARMVQGMSSEIIFKAVKVNDKAGGAKKAKSGSSSSERKSRETKSKRSKGSASSTASKKDEL